jgi:diguanylate cyclase (GGDEF)-like protein/putative nucleotidyltransferase with HDIG domain
MAAVDSVLALTDALADGDVERSQGVVLAALGSGMAATAVLAHVIAPAMHEIGERWERSEISVADEHLASAQCTQLLALVYEHLLCARPRSRGRVLLACLEGEHHMIGLRMAADVLEGAGFDVVFLGADLPTTALVDAVARLRPAIVGLAVTGRVLAPVLTTVIAVLRAEDPHVGIILGGRGVPEDVVGVRVEVLRDVMDLAAAAERLDRSDRAEPAPAAPARGPMPKERSSRDEWFEAAATSLADLTRRHAAQAYGLRLDKRQLEDAARTDPLTGLANRRALAERMSKAFAADTANGEVGMVLLDIDHFKQVNDVYGHGAGDAVLRETAARILAATPTGLLVARWGGEEFAVLAEDVKDEDALLDLAASVLAALRATTIDADGAPVALTASAGVACWDGGEESTALVDRADAALYAAKRRGRDQAVAYGALRAADLAAEASPALRLAHGVALAASVREGMPALHCEQVSDLAAATAIELGYEQGMVARCRLGGLLHDVGKLAIPDRILGKRGPLDDDEWQVMRSHAAVGARLVEQIGGLDTAAGAVHHHHERFDGTGYPDGLAGEEIPIEARVVAAADAFSAITSDRPYARGRAVSTALAEIRSSAGTHLDPAVAEALCSAVVRAQAATRARFDETVASRD